MKGKEIDMESAKENLSWVTNVLWDVHRLAQDQFILRTQDQTQQWLENVYGYVPLLNWKNTMVNLLT